MADGGIKQGLEVRPVAGFIGAEISGVDLKQPLSDDEVARIRAALLTWKVVFFRGQNIDNAQHIAFSARFGEVTYAHPLEDEPVDSAHPQVLAIDRRRYERKDGRRYTYESRWHTDVTAVVNPPAGSILRAINVPAFGGDTTWTNLVAAYDGLSAPLKALANSLRAEHRFGARVASHEDNPFLRRINKNPQVSIHPVVRVHPETGERALFVSPGFTSKLVGLSQIESDRLLDLFFEQIARPEYTVRFRWNAGDIAFWDNRATAHLGPRDLDHLDVERVLYRITLTGDIPVGVDGFRSEIVQGQLFGTEPSLLAKKREGASQSGGSSLRTFAADSHPGELGSSRWLLAPSDQSARCRMLRELEILMGLVDPEWATPMASFDEASRGAEERESGVYPTVPGPPPPPARVPKSS